MKRILVVAAAVTLLASGSAAAQSRRIDVRDGSSSEVAALPPVAREADLDEQLGRRINPNLEFVDEAGRRVRLGDAFTAHQPVLLVLAYYRCPMLCGLVLHGLVDGLKQLDWTLGERYRALTVSFDPRDTPDAARQKRASTLAALDLKRPADGAWPFLVGEGFASHALADEIGFRYAYDERTDQYAHPAAVVVLTPDGRISRYLYGVTFTARDLRLALLEASDGKVGTIVDRVLMTCYRFDPATRRYGPYVLGFVRLGGVLILLAVGGLLAALWRFERRRPPHEPGAKTTREAKQ